MKEGLIEQLKTQEKFFLNTIDCFTEEDSAFKPQDDMYTIAEHIGHVAETVTWFFNGVFKEEGFDMNFDGYVPCFIYPKHWKAAVHELTGIIAISRCGSYRQQG